MKPNLTPVTLPRCHSEWPKKVQDAMRVALRKELSLQKPYISKQLAKALSKLDLDVIAERAWNAAVVASGHDKLCGCNHEP